jgi:hypothetical protein
MRAAEAVEDFFCGIRLIAGSLFVIGVVVLAGLFIVTGVLMAQADKWFSNPRRGCGGLV